MGASQTRPDQKTDVQDLLEAIHLRQIDLPAAEMMPFCTIVEKQNGVVVGAELACSIKEENKAQRESYSADWHSVRIKSRPEDR